MTQWFPGQPGTHPDLPPAPISGGTALDLEMSQILIAEVLTQVGAERSRQISSGHDRGTDASHSPLHWHSLVEAEWEKIAGSLDRDGIENTEDFQRTMIHIAALACAAVEASSNWSTT